MSTDQSGSLPLPKERVEANSRAIVASLTPSQVQALKLARSGDLHSAGGRSWTHLNAAVTYARSDRFKERPIKVRSATTTTVERLTELDLLRNLDGSNGEAHSPRTITMAGKLWLLMHK
ncbi:hypothetical protein Rhsp01_63390 [Rhizobium sp. NBRC 114257]|uniref:Uncharacterized protein n=1 Tax=Rhizobium dioscoreae TaxID=2653122 RepID=A0ABQ0ZE82_9HYPH|nr:hypothetical protein RsS93_63370 [Rhizobium dioscoreae]GLU85163.1 hypothetical protein Rhsp01_63390 [Rhizobium sp. NBRC 114257]